jgi:hypothetical protein
MGIIAKRSRPGGIYLRVKSSIAWILVFGIWGDNFFWVDSETWND